ncbi:trafficking protein particle complex subunit 13, partial [Tremellales sp. Uapishka_1]
MSLGETISARVELTSILSTSTKGVRMMTELQSPSARIRLGEVIHGSSNQGEDTEAAMPELQSGEKVDLAVETEIKELGMHVMICSVAWETLEGRKTFQRFFKFIVGPAGPSCVSRLTPCQVNAPLAIKTRIHTSTSPSAALSPVEREKVFLEVLMQNISPSGMLFDQIFLEPVHGLVSESVPPHDKTTLLPNDTRQYLFVLSPAPTPTTGKRSSFPPTYAAGAILPLGRLDVSWYSGQYREKGRLQTSTLNRRIPLSPASAMSRTGSKEEPIPPASPSGWEFDLSTIEPLKQVDMEEEFKLKLRVAVRTAQNADSTPPPPSPTIAIQYLSRPPPPSQSHPLPPIPPPQRALSPLSRKGTPLSPTSRPLTPLTNSLRQASMSTLVSPLSASPLPPLPEVPTTLFPPPPVLSKPPASHAKQLASDNLMRGEISYLGNSMTILPSVALELVEENQGTSYTEQEDVPKRLEATWEIELRFLALEEGIAELGGMRVLVLEDESNLKGSVGQEWESVGEVWVAS